MYYISRGGSVFASRRGGTQLAPNERRHGLLLCHHLVRQNMPSDPSFWTRQGLVSWKHSLQCNGPRRYPGIFRTISRRYSIASASRPLSVSFHYGSFSPRGAQSKARTAVVHAAFLAGNTAFDQTLITCTSNRNDTPTQGGIINVFA